MKQQILRALRFTKQQRRDAAGGMLKAGRFNEAIKEFRSIYLENPGNRTHFAEYFRALVIADQQLEMKSAAVDVDFAIFDPVRPVRMHDLDLLERTIYAEVCDEVCQTPEAIAQLSRVVRYLQDNHISGDFVECGVYRGASIICMIRTLQAYRDKRNIWLYDTFEGMPKPEPVDRFYSNDKNFIPDWDTVKRDDGGSNWARGPIEVVQENIGRTSYDPLYLHFVKGMVEETIPQRVPGKIALLRLDTDFYASTKHELVHLYPRVVSGGVVIIDDYGAFEGARKATDEYIRENELRVVLSRIDEHVRMWVKP
jgi:hypothetical protein